MARAAVTVRATLRGELLHPSKYLAAVEFKGRDVTLTIKSVTKQELQRTDGTTERKPVIAFNETQKLLVCNKTNAASIAIQHGTDAGTWAGKRITLFPGKDTCFGKVVDCIRVREAAPSGSSPRSAPDASAAFVPDEEEARRIREEEAANERG